MNSFLAEYRDFSTVRREKRPRELISKDLSRRTNPHHGVAGIDVDFKFGVNRHSGSRCYRAFEVNTRPISFANKFKHD